MKLNKIVLVTGASSGIGKATARIFAKQGYDLIITGRRSDHLQMLRNKYTLKYGIEVKCLVFDIRNRKEAEKHFRKLPAYWKKIDILINNAGLAKGKDFIHEGSIDDWEAMIDTNIKGLLYMTRLVSPFMVKEKRGHIINVCSTAGHEVYAKGNVYCATKYAVDALTKSIRLDLYQHGIRVSQVSPGMVEETEFAMVRFDGNEKQARIYEDFNPLRSRDVADIIYFMSSRPRHVNIQDVIVMGTQQASNQFIDRSGRKYDTD